jgi:hypothetical protein
MTGRLLTIAVLMCGLAGATTITASLDDSRGEYYVWFNQNGAPVDAWYVGVVTIALGEDGVTYNRDTMCVDLFTDIVVNEEYGTDVLLPDQVTWREPADLERVAWLIDNALVPTQSPVLSTGIPQADWVTTAAQGAGLQLAIWDITVDGGDGLKTGLVQASTTAGETTDSAVLSAANTYENDSVGKSSNVAFVYENFSLSNGSPAQMLEGPEFANGPSPTPEPSTCPLGAAGLMAAAYLARRKRTY